MVPSPWNHFGRRHFTDFVKIINWFVTFRAAQIRETWAASSASARQTVQIASSYERIAPS